jgi:hypothetical protein
VEEDQDQGDFELFLLLANWNKVLLQDWQSLKGAVLDKEPIHITIV